MPTRPKRGGGEVWTKTLDCKEAARRVGSQISFIWAHKASIRWGFGGLFFPTDARKSTISMSKTIRVTFRSRTCGSLFYMEPLICTARLTFVQTCKRTPLCCLFILFRFFLPIHGRTQASMCTTGPLLRVWNNKCLCSLRWEASSNFE